MVFEKSLRPSALDEDSPSIGRVKKVFEGEMFTKTLSTTFLQIFFKFMLYSKVQMTLVK